jgi:hypothetical protein
LLAQLASALAVDDLGEIVPADYGQDVEEHLVALRRICATREVPSPMPWRPGEVLELIRWSEPEDPEWRLLELARETSVEAP